jgi:DNA-binding LacI/PurR family transcriptional regulator
MEKYEIPFGPERIAYGDYSSCVQKQVNHLLDAYPDMEAMICANDVMAETAYRECNKRGLIVGKDIAITGFDDCERASGMEPPLTTVQQDGNLPRQ